MFGWEFPPFNTGGLGTACQGLTRGLANKGAEVIFVLPRIPGAVGSDIKLVSANIGKTTIKMVQVNSLLRGYITAEEYNEQLKQMGFTNLSHSVAHSVYASDLFLEVLRYAKSADRIAREEKFDVIHAHDWLTFKAGIVAKRVSGKPLVVHVHATEFDRSGGHSVNQFVYDIEREGMHLADKVIAVSNFTKEKIVHHYGIPPSKVEVVHNAVDFTDRQFSKSEFKIKETDKVVLFLGRITLQKGPDYFIEAAKKVLEFEPNVKFIVAGSGDMEHKMIEKAIELGIIDKVLFAGFLRGEDIDKAYQMADVYVMPSVSEPFGITALESMMNKTPIIISKQSGVSEVVKHCLKVDFWDINQLVNKIVAVLKYKDLKSTLAEHGSEEVSKFSWDIPARKCIDIYNKVLRHG